MISNIFTTRKIKDPVTGEEKIISAKEQEEMLEKGILFDLPFEKADDEKKESDNEEKK